ncbi:hypothetical protein NM688_g7479 [Phlebia brevispora]|uniref:Uncharacterized protein n=1 Tax=Phlebia brevispora TaxID=194682 RepID=A0ACC1S4M8_9APHY|nr:hypothetical protein NM688_g7479 [Phlebia brevispora]
MPRILPRLLKALQEARSRPSQNRPPNVYRIKHRNRTKSLWRPVPELSYSPRGRTHSILLDELNPIFNHDNYVRHKTLPPKVWLSDSAQKTRAGASGREEDRPSTMSKEERDWWASPYLRMLSGPLRRCLVSTDNLPADFLIKLAPMQLPVPRTARKAQTLLPDGIEHPRFRHRRHGSGVYIMCRKVAVDYLVEKEAYKVVGQNVSIHSRLADQIGHLLRLRVLQELELLADRLQCRPAKAQDHPILRRLTRAEWQDVKNTGVIPYEGAIALLIVPPLNRDPSTKRRPEPSTSPLPIQDAGPIPKKPLPPISVLHLASKEDFIDEDVDEPSMIPNAKVPLYNGLALFPARPQRAALYAALNKLLYVERRARWREHGRPDPSVMSADEKADKWARGDQKASHAYLLCSDSETVLRADAVPLAIALWRIRMWEGLGTRYNLTPEQRWKLKPIPLPS